MYLGVPPLGAEILQICTNFLFSKAVFYHLSFYVWENINKKTLRLENIKRVKKRQGVSKKVEKQIITDIEGWSQPSERSEHKQSQFNCVNTHPDPLTSSKALTLGNDDNTFSHCTRLIVLLNGRVP